MTKRELIAAVAKDTGHSEYEVGRVMDATSDVIMRRLKRRDEVRLAPLGTFGTVKRKARTGRNPQTGESVRIAATTAPKFKPSATLKGAVGGRR